MHRLIVCALVLTAACDQVERRDRLDHAQILAVRTEPATVAPGARARIDLLAGDAAGAVFEAAPETVTAAGPGGPLAVVQGDDGWHVTAGPTPGVGLVDVTVTIDGTTWAARKALVVGETVPSPQITTMQIDGAAGDELVVAAGTRPSLGVVGEGRAPFDYAWYSAVGDLEGYLRPTAILDAAAPAEGTVVVVVRDTAGGVAWRRLPATIE
jgi:hypothetical protein